MALRVWRHGRRPHARGRLPRLRLGGLGNGAGWIAAVTAVQERIPLTTQSAVMSVLKGLNQVMPAIGFAVGGAITAATSPRDAYAVAAIGGPRSYSWPRQRPNDHIQPVAQDRQRHGRYQQTAIQKSQDS